jgi:hypothetical protein
MARRNERGPRQNGQALLCGWHELRLRNWTRTLAALLMASFVWPYLAFALESSDHARVDSPSSEHLLVNGTKFQLPPEMGRVVSSYQGKSGRTVVFIHDLHCNYEVQSNIARILETLVKNHGLQLIGVEGESQPVSVSAYTAFPIADVRKGTADYFLHQGRITGAESLAIGGDYTLALEGIETQGLYNQDRESLLKFLNEESQGNCEDLKAVLERLKASLYTLDLAKLDHLRQEFDFESNNLETYCSQLLNEAQRLGVATSSFPVLSLYAANHRLPLTAEADYDKLQADAESLDQALREKLYTSPDQRQFDHYLRLLRIMEAMISISATAADLTYYRTHHSEFVLTDMVKFLDTVCYRNAVDLDLGAGTLKLDGYLREAARFYDVADQRSEAFVRNLLELMQQQDRKAAVMITGGSHAAKVEAELRRQNVSYVAIKPRLTRAYDDTAYFSLLRGQKAPLEKLLVQTQSLFAPRSQLVDRVFQRYWGLVLGMKLPEYYIEKMKLPVSEAMKRADVIRRATQNTPFQIPYDYANARTNAAQDLLLLTAPNNPFSIVIRKARVRSGEKDRDYILAREDLDNGYEFLVLANQARNADGKYILSARQTEDMLGPSHKGFLEISSENLDRFAGQVVKTGVTERLTNRFSAWGSRFGATVSDGGRSAWLGLTQRFAVLPRAAGGMAGVLTAEQGRGRRLTPEDFRRIERAWRQARSVGYGLGTAPGVQFDDILLRVIMKEQGFMVALEDAKADLEKAKADLKQLNLLLTREGLRMQQIGQGLTDKAQIAAAEKTKADLKQAIDTRRQDIVKLHGMIQARDAKVKAASAVLENFRRISSTDQGLALLGIAWHQGATLPPVLLARGGEENMLAFVEEFNQAEALAEAVINRSTPEVMPGDAWLTRLVKGMNSRTAELSLGQDSPEEGLRLLLLLWPNVSAKQTEAIKIILSEVAKESRPALRFHNSLPEILQPKHGFQLLNMEENQAAALQAQVQTLAKSLSTPIEFATQKPAPAQTEARAEQPQAQAAAAGEAGSAWSGAEILVKNSALMLGARAVLKRILAGRAVEWSLGRLRAGWHPGVVVRVLFLLGQVERSQDAWVWTQNSVLGALLARKGLPLVGPDKRPLNRRIQPHGGFMQSA